jgi:hypothetical protein
MKNEPGQLNTLVGNKLKSNEDCIASTIKDAPEHKKKMSRQTSHYSSDNDRYTEEGFVADHQFFCSPSTRRLAEQMGRHIITNKNFPQKKGTTISAFFVLPTRTLVGKENWKQLLSAIDFQKIENKICK